MTVYIVFVAGIAVMVYKSSSQKIDLVTTDYYAKELKYQDRINAIKRTETLSAKVAYEVKDNTVIITLPSEFEMKEVTGNALLYYPADDGKDIKKDFITNNRTVRISIPASAKGSYQLQLNWIAEGSDYYFEKNIFL